MNGESETSSAKASKRALVVDDSRVMRTMLRRLLERRGFDVVEAENGKAALDRLALMRIPDLALVDWNMPEMNGIDLILALRLDRNYDRMLVMMVTTETEMSQVQRAMSAGANEYVMKPFSEDVLGDKLTLLGFEDHG
ncbi:MAG TPA: response regulator [Polyangiaceae bacterium]|nr:response regulator [Polyangiaceae bacterium]